jgi:predicted acylesterase/phospholipase RssA
MSEKLIIDTKAKEFDEVLEAEIGEIEKSRGKRWRQGCAMPKTENVRRRAAFFDLIGLAFSGGGIRSATFNLGVLQGLARFNLLRLID